MANTLTIQAMWAARTKSGNTPRTASYPITAGQTYNLGAVLVLTTGQLVEGGTNPTSILGVTSSGTTAAAKGTPGLLLSGTFDGSSIQPGYGGNGQQSVWLAVQDTLFAIAYSGALPNINSAAFIGTTYGITKDATTGYWYLDSTKNASNQRMLVEDVVDPMALGFWGGIGDTNGIVLASFLSAQTMFGN